MSRKPKNDLLEARIEQLKAIIISGYETMLWDMSYNPYGDEPMECLSPKRTHEENFDLIREKLPLSNFIVLEVIERFLKDQEITEEYHEKIDGIDRFKIAGFLTFWIVKLKPIMILNEALTEDELLVNELLAITVASSFLRDKDKNPPPFSIKLIEDLKYTLRYRINTRNHISLIYEALCVNLEY